MCQDPRVKGRPPGGTPHGQRALRAPLLVPAHDGAVPLSSALLPRPYPLCLKGYLHGHPQSGQDPTQWTSALQTPVAERRTFWQCPTDGSSSFQNQHSFMTEPSLLRHRVLDTRYSMASLSLKLHTCFISSSRTTV